MLDNTDREDIYTLLYTMHCDGWEQPRTYKVFRTVLDDESVTAKMLDDLSAIMAIIVQYQQTEDTPSEESNQTPDTISSIVATLIMNGLDARYALNEMELYDLPMYIKSYESKKQEEMESSRLWTFLSMLPHIDAQKMVNGAKDLILFPWEEAPENTQIRESEAKSFEEFMKKGKNLWQEERQTTA